MKDEMARGEKVAAVINSVEEDDKNQCRKLIKRC